VYTIETINQVLATTARAWARHAVQSTLTSIVRSVGGKS